MGLFDFPRIHFSGNVDINVPTINNAYYFPLTIYDATRSEAYLPPRLYFSSSEIIKNVSPSINPVINDDVINGYYYIEILPVNTIGLLREWCMKPLGTDTGSPDNMYLPYYHAADSDLCKVEGAPITGFCPGYWNMYGDMSVKMSNVLVTGVQTFDGGNLNTWTNASHDIPPDISPFLNASFDLDTAPASGITTASMVETISSQSVYANIFCSNVNLYDSANADNIFLQGKPFRFSAGIYSGFRVLNWWPAMAGSARFCSSIPLKEIPEAGQAQLIQFFNANNGYDGRMLMGVFVTFTTFEVFENRYDQQYYINNGTKANPAQATTVGSITPWYEGDMLTGILGRNLISLGMNPIYNNTNSAPPNVVPISMAPVITSLRVLNNGTAVFSVDMGNSWPEIMIPAFSKDNFQPIFRGDATFETPDLGNLVFQYGSDSSTEITTIAVNPVENPRNTVFQKGCVFDFVLTDATLIQNIQNNLLQVFLSTAAGTTQVLKEAEYMITTDQKGMYGNQGDLPSGGYQVYNEQKEPCRLRIFQKGIAVTTPIKVAVAEYIVPQAANDPLRGPDNIQWQSLSDNDIVALSASSLQLNNTAVYYFVYDQQYPNNAIPVFNTGGYTVMDTGSFACLRVHQIKDYAMYLDPAHPDYTVPSFDTVYQEIFKMYDVAYPIMALVHPFTNEVWDNGTIAGLVIQRTDPTSWNDILYMPKSRELSPSQLALLKAWAAKF